MMIHQLQQADAPTESFMELIIKVEYPPSTLPPEQYHSELLQQQSSALPSSSSSSPSSLPRRSSLGSTPTPPVRRKPIQGAYSKCQQSNNSGSAAIPIPVSNKKNSKATTTINKLRKEAIQSYSSSGGNTADVVNSSFTSTNQLPPRRRLSIERLKGSYSLLSRALHESNVVADNSPSSSSVINQQTTTTGGNAATVATNSPLPRRESWRKLKIPSSLSSGTTNNNNNKQQTTTNVKQPGQSSKLLGSIKSTLKPIAGKGSSAIPSDLLRPYAGPQPTNVDGLPLKSCFKTKKTCNDTPQLASSPDSVIEGDNTVHHQQHQQGRRVIFNCVDVREYSRIAGDNPSVSGGCPLSIGWEYNICNTQDINTYETNRAEQRGGDNNNNNNPLLMKSCRRPPVLNHTTRVAILLEIGEVSKSDILAAQTEAYTIKCQRLETMDAIGGLQNCNFVGPVERLTMVKESTKRKLDRAKKGITPVKAQQQLWDEAEKKATSTIGRVWSACCVLRAMLVVRLWQTHPSCCPC